MPRNDRVTCPRHGRRARQWHLLRMVALRYAYRDQLKEDEATDALIEEYHRAWETQP